MKRRLVNILAVLLLLLFTATIGLWLQSYWTAIAASRHSRPCDGAALRTVELSVRQGRVIVARSLWGRGGDAKVGYSYFMSAADAVYGWDVDSRWMGLGWSYERTPPDMADSSLAVISVPCWFLSAVLAFPLIVCIYRRSRMKGTAGLCLTCGYDLRASPERCPECGSVPGGDKQTAISN